MGLNYINHYLTFRNVLAWFKKFCDYVLESPIDINPPDCDRQSQRFKIWENSIRRQVMAFFRCLNVGTANEIFRNGKFICDVDEAYARKLDFPNLDIQHLENFIREFKHIEKLTQDKIKK